jgi:predicted ATPase/DNA-binding SARP family transcriptional activator
MEYRVLGPLEARDGEGPLALGGAKQRALLALLLLNANRVVSRERLIDELWGDEPPATAVTMVQVYVSRLRKLLPEGSLLTRASGYLLEVEPEMIDLQRFEGLVAEARGAEPERASRLLGEALALWRGPPLAEFDEPFARVEGGRLEDLRLAVLEERIEADLALGRHADVVGELESLLAEHPHRERLRGQLMLALYRSGRQAEALQAYRDARAALDELGIKPSEELRALEKRILTQDAALASARRKTNLPAEPTPLVGRGRELAEVLALVRANRLVTLTGAGGSGKTRLALRAAGELLDEFADGVWFVSLASLSDPELVESAIAQVLGARGDLNEFLRGKQLLLLLDNLEQLLPGASSIVAGLEAKVLATSRERLNLTAENEYLVPTLSLDDAVALFTERARRLKPQFWPDEHVAELARRLDGLPLALELAAARVKVLTPAQISGRLGQSLDLLSGGGRDRPERQRTLRATLEWSYDLLDEEERRTFARLAIFASSFGLDMADAIAEADIDTLQSLVDKSLLTPTGNDRFAMLDTLRTFAREQLEPAEFETLRDRQLQLLEPLATRSPASAARGLAFSSDEQLVWLNEVETLLPDIREALAWALARDPARAGLLICRLVDGFLIRGGGGHEVGTWLERLLRQRSALPDEVLAEALAHLGYNIWHEGDLEAAAALLHESIELFRALGDRTMAAWATYKYALTLFAAGAYADALELAERVLADFRDVDNKGGVAGTLSFIGGILLQLGEFDGAREMLRQAIVAAESIGDYTVDMLHSLADLELEQRNLGEAEMLYLRAHDIAREFKDRVDVAYCLAGLACVAALRGHVELAGKRWGHVERIEDGADFRLHRAERERYERIVEAVANDAAFRRGYEAGRAAATEVIDSLPALAP